MATPLRSPRGRPWTKHGLRTLLGTIHDYSTMHSHIFWVARDRFACVNGVDEDFSLRAAHDVVKHRELLLIAVVQMRTEDEEQLAQPDVCGNALNCVHHILLGTIFVQGAHAWDGAVFNLFSSGGLLVLYTFLNVLIVENCAVRGYSEATARLRNGEEVHPDKSLSRPATLFSAGG